MLKFSHQSVNNFAGNLCLLESRIGLFDLHFDSFLGSTAYDARFHVLRRLWFDLGQVVRFGNFPTAAQLCVKSVNKFVLAVC